jgi:SAM-dependent methyltransferase
MLDVGSDTDGCLITQIFRLYQPVEVIGINLLAPRWEIAPGCRLEPGDICKTTYADDYFDLIVSSSAFEHIHNFDVALAEMYRILKPGGYLFSHFGPIWSTSYGHHLWVTHNGKLYNYWNVILPPYCHLLMTRQRLADELAKAHPPEIRHLICEYVFSSPERNQLFYEDYEAIIKKSAFEVIVFKGYDAWELREKYDVSITPETFRLLREKYPERRQFGYDGITVLVAKPEKAVSGGAV